MTTDVGSSSSDSSPGQRFISWGGIAFVYLSAAAFVALGYRLLFYPYDRGSGLAGYTAEFILFGVAVFTALLGVSLLRATGLAFASAWTCHKSGGVGRSKTEGHGR